MAGVIDQPTEQFKFAAFERELLDPLAGHSLTDHEEFIAHTLLDASSDRPMKIQALREAMHQSGRSAISTRMLKRIVRTLRKDHGFPILSRRAEPAGLWWCASAAEMESFIQLFSSQALDELHTLSKIVRHNYPQLSGQLNFEDLSNRRDK